MISIINSKDCCGCTACVSICTHNAISMIPDSLGFLYPKVDVTKCVDCGLCDTVCQFNDKYDCSLNLVEPIAYAARHKDISEVMKSRSGAVFVALSDRIIEKGGVVYGAGYQDHFRVVHKRAMTKNERDEFRGSKYVQSDLTGIFAEVKKDLKDGRKVLFSGTPCQTAGLNSFVGKKLRENLYLIDIVCHGVPSPYIWRDYLAYLERKKGSELIYVNFRDKTKYGWAAHTESFIFKDEKKIDSRLYSQLFYSHLILRHSCGVCHFTNLNRPSDITLADFWGWEKVDSTFNIDDKGCSLVLCNTQKGNDLFYAVIESMNIIPVDLAQIIQPNLEHPTTIPLNRDYFEETYAKYGFKKTMKFFGFTINDTFISKVRIRKIIRKVIDAISD